MTGLKGKERIFCECAKVGDLQKMRSLEGEISQECKDRALCWAARAGKEEAVLILVEMGADVGYKQAAALRFAADKGYINMIKALRERGADLHVNNDVLLTYAVVNGYKEVEEYLREQGAVIQPAKHVSRVAAF